MKQEGHQFEDEHGSGNVKASPEDGRKQVDFVGQHFAQRTVSGLERRVQRGRRRRRRTGHRVHAARQLEPECCQQFHIDVKGSGDSKYP